VPDLPVRVLIADDHPLFRSGMRALLDADVETACAGEVSSGEDAIAAATALTPDVILMDLKLPGISGIDATRQILERAPNARVLVVTMFENDHSVFAAMRAGARGYVLKGAAPDEMLRAIKAAASGEAIFSPTIASRLIEFFATLQPSALPNALPGLTEREREILELIAHGRSNPQIAMSLHLSSKTVANHVSNIFGKLHVTDRAQAMLRARKAGLGDEGSS
jgi:DNA-binding NarL/FixJ family response regulator